MNLTTTSLTGYLGAILESGDPIVLDFIFVRNSVLPFGAILCYLLVSKYVGPWLMKNKTTPDLRKVIFVYDIFSVVANALVAYKSTRFLPTYGLGALCREAQNPTEELVRLELINVVYSLYVLKFIEMLDTAFFLLKKKFSHISNLHLFHHSTAPILVWLSLRSQRRMNMMVYGAINCVIHIIMYSYYGLSALGSEYQIFARWKKYITLLQITQFIVMIPYFVFLLISDCANTKLPFFIYLLHTAFLLAYFIEFYSKTYMTPSKKTKQTISKNQETKHGKIEYPVCNGKSKDL